jgi:N-acetylneuraminic acid mutarotase
MKAFARRAVLRGGLVVSVVALVVSVVFLVRGAPTGAPQDVGWLSVSKLLTGRSDHTATRLKNGAVLVAGGMDAAGKALASAELFDPQRNVWRSAADMVEARLNHTATVLLDGRVLVVGGFADQPPTSSALRSAEIYDPVINRWTAVSDMHVKRARQTATLLANGSVLVVGGIDGGITTSGSSAYESEVYDPRGNTWLAVPDNHSRNGHTATRLPDGRVAIIGGFSEDGCPDATTQLYDPGLGRWSSGPSMRIGRGGHTATMLQGGKILVIGGTGASTCTAATSLNPLMDAQVYDSNENSWSDLIPMDVGRLQHTATLTNGLVLVVGSATGKGVQAELFDATRRTWTQVRGPVNLYGHTATALDDSRVLIAGGRSASILTSGLIFDPRLRVSGRTLDWRLFPGGILAVGLLLLWLTTRRTLAQALRSRNSDSWRAS